MRRRGFTLVELLLALGLLSILVLALVRLIDTSTQIWGHTENTRELGEISTAILDLAARDLQALEGGPAGDLVGEWMTFDGDKDGIRGLLMPRVRLVRQASAAELLRVAPGTAVTPRTLGCMQVAWALLPSDGADKDARVVGTLWRGERAVGDDATLDFFAPGFFNTSGRAVPGALREVAGGVLWFALDYATQTTLLDDGWRSGDDLGACASSWDAWNRERPGTTLTFLNEPGAGMPRETEVALLPRRVRVTLEIERPIDRRRRPRLLEELDSQVELFRVDDDVHLPPVGTLLLIDEEWVELTSVSGRQVSVKRARRGSRAGGHAPGALLHYGAASVREIPIATYREDWKL